MLKWGKSALQGSSWKHRHSFSTSDIEYKFEKNKYKKMDSSSDFSTSLNEKSYNNNIKKEKWLSSSVTESCSDSLYSNRSRRDSNYSNNSSSTSHSSNLNNSVALIPEPIKEKDALEWKNYVKYEIKNKDYINLSITELLKEYVDKNLHKSLFNDTNKTYQSKIKLNENKDKNPFYDDFVNNNQNQNSIISYTNQHHYNNNNNNEEDHNENDEKFIDHFINHNNSNINTNNNFSLTDYDIQTIEYNLKYNSNYEIEDIPEEIIMELLNHQIQYKESTSFINNENSTKKSINNNSNSIFISSSPIMIPSVETKPSSIHNYSSYSNYSINNNFSNINDLDTILREDNHSFTSELTAKVSQPMSIDKQQETNWSSNSLYVIQEIPNLSNYSNCNSEEDNNINYRDTNRRYSEPFTTRINEFDYNYSISSDYHQFYIDNRPQSKKHKRGIKNAIKVSCKHIRNSIKLKPRKSSTTTTDTGNTTFYTMDENDKDNNYTDIISFNDALNLPIEKNSK